MAFCVATLPSGELLIDTAVPPCPELTFLSDIDVENAINAALVANSGGAGDITPWELMLTTIDVATVETITGWSFMGLAIGLGGGWLYKSIRSGW